MKRILVVLILVLTTVLIYSAPSHSAEQAAPVRIGVVDIDKVILESKGGKDARSQFEKEFSAKKKTLKDKEDAVKKLRADIDKGGLSAADKKEREKVFQKEARELRRLMDETESELKDMDKAITSKMIGDIRKVISKVGEDGKYTIILEKDSRVLYMMDTINLTGKVIEDYDKQKSKK